ncbi:unnamed protein product [Ilex paraguariensis]|uniref:Uncharacterized protein n=1 Tax=Ilex paraguariensis TaxID=185542 RepID=A0ABC8T9I1_9AQUA
MYYTFYSWTDGIVGSCANLAMGNSSWTHCHIEKLWKITDYCPPCDTLGLQVLLLERSINPPKLISVAQFLPEKAHSLQLEAFSVAIKKLDSEFPRPRLLFVGSCRNEADEKRLQNLKDPTVRLKVEEDVDFYKNVTYSFISFHFIF